MSVSFNYRLGPLGFFPRPDVAKDSGDFGLMDREAALRWVYEGRLGARFQRRRLPRKIASVR